MHGQHPDLGRAEALREPEVRAGALSGGSAPAALRSANFIPSGLSVASLHSESKDRSRPKPPQGASVALIALVLVAICLGCAHHPSRMARARVLMARQQYDSALKQVEAVCESENDVLCLLERGLLLHYAGRYRESNEVFERAETLTEDLYTMSISREAASLVTSNLALKYVPRPFEQVLVAYFRALNYMFLGQEDDALVECRKASLRLDAYSEEDKRPYRQDAFMEYLTGILYEWGGETNNAFVSYRRAADAYQTYDSLFGIGAPSDLICSLDRTGLALGFEPADGPEASAGDACPDSVIDPPPSLAKVVVFIEQGFAPPLEEWSVGIPILKSEARHAYDDPYFFSLGIAPRMYGGITFDAHDIEYLLRIALPSYPDVPRVTREPALFIDSLAWPAAKCEDVALLARAELDQDMPKVFAKTLARAIVKYKLADVVERRHGWIAGGIVNLVTAAAEQADLRAWLSLPRSIYIATAYLGPGAHTITLPASLSAHGSRDVSPDIQEIVLDVALGTTSFVRFRQY
jgi:hypothetical protein